MNEEQFINIINSQPIFAHLYFIQKQERKLAKAKKLREKRQAHRLLNPLVKPYRKNYFTRNVFTYENSN
jgi:hypothetical protein